MTFLFNEQPRKIVDDLLLQRRMDVQVMQRSMPTQAELLTGDFAVIELSDGDVTLSR